MKSVFQFSVAICLVLLVVTCKKDSSDAFMSDATSSLSYGFFKSVPLSNEANQLRSSSYSASFEITKAERNKEVLTVTVTYPDGCNDSGFEVIWNGLVLETYPEIIFLYVKRTSACKVTGNPSFRILSINLATRLGDAALGQRVKVILCNTSKQANTINSDIPVSSN